jgi:hypothetical protein
LRLCSSYLPLGVPNWTVKNYQHRAASVYVGPICARMMPRSAASARIVWRPGQGVKSVRFFGTPGLARPRPRPKILPEPQPQPRPNFLPEPDPDPRQNPSRKKAAALATLAAAPYFPGGGALLLPGGDALLLRGSPLCLPSHSYEP